MNVFEKFKKAPLESRKKQAQQLIQKNNGRIPMLVQSNKSISFSLQKSKFLANRSMNVREFLLKVRKRSNVAEDKGIFFYCNNKLLTPQLKLGDIYDQYKDEDGFLYLTLSEMSTMG